MRSYIKTILHSVPLVVWKLWETASCCVFCSARVVKVGLFILNNLKLCRARLVFIFILCLYGQNIHVCKTLLIDADSLFLLVYVYCFSPLCTFQKPRKCSIAFFIGWSPSRKLNMAKSLLAFPISFWANWKVFTTLQSLMNVKLSKQKFQHCYENGLIKMIQTIPQNL